MGINALCYCNGLLVVEMRVTENRLYEVQRTKVGRGSATQPVFFIETSFEGT